MSPSAMPLRESCSSDPLQALSSLTSELERQYLDQARNVLRQLLDNPHLLKGKPLLREASSYTRNLLFGDDRLSAWALVWAPGSATPIHDHHCSCCFAVLSGCLTEVWFTPAAEGKASVSRESVREAGYAAAMMPTGPNIHQMRNDSGVEAISVHIYGYDHRRCDSSIHRVYELSR